MKEYSKKASKIHSGKNNSMYGKKQTDFMTEEAIIKWKENISKSMKEKVKDVEYKNKLSKSLSGKNNPMYGKTGKDSPNYGKKRTEEQKEKMREKMLEAHNKRILEESIFEKNVLMYDLNDNLINKFPSLKICARKTGLRGDCIKNVLEGKWKKHKGYKFKYEGE